MYRIARVGVSSVPMSRRRPERKPNAPYISKELEALKQKREVLYKEVQESSPLHTASQSVFLGFMSPLVGLINLSESVREFENVAKKKTEIERLEKEIKELTDK